MLGLIRAAHLCSICKRLSQLRIRRIPLSVLGVAIAVSLIISAALTFSYVQKRTRDEVFGELFGNDSSALSDGVDGIDKFAQSALHSPANSSISSTGRNVVEGACLPRNAAERFLFADTCQWGQSNQMQEIAIAINFACVLGRSLVEPAFCASMTNAMGTPINKATDYFDLGGSAAPFFANCERWRSELSLPALSSPLRVVPLDEFARLFCENVTASGVDPRAVSRTLGQRDYIKSPTPSSRPWRLPWVGMQVTHGFAVPVVSGRQSPLFTRALNVDISEAAFIIAPATESSSLISNLTSPSPPPAVPVLHSYNSMHVFWQPNPDELDDLIKDWDNATWLAAAPVRERASLHGALPFADAAVVSTFRLHGQRIIPFADMNPFFTGSIRPNEDILAFAREIILANQPYISSHLRLRDFSEWYCEKKVKKSPTTACGVNMTLAPDALVDAAARASITTLIVASDGTPQELDDFEKRVEELAGPPGLRIFRLSEALYHTRFQTTTIDAFKFALVEKLLLACGKIIFTTADSTFSNTAMPMRAFISECQHLRPEVRVLPPLYGKLGRR